MMKNLRERIPFALAAAVFLVILTTLAVKSLQANAGHLIYTLDDPYIHMAIAKNLAAHGVFGVTRFSFSSTTSAPLWTLLLAASYALFGVSDWIPGILATLFALAALYSADSLCRLLSVGTIGRSIICLAVVYFTPLVPVVSTGLEHAMHLFLAIVFIRTTIRFARDPGGRTFVYMCFGGIARSSRTLRIPVSDCPSCPLVALHEAVARSHHARHIVFPACGRLRGFLCNERLLLPSQFAYA